MKTFLALYRNGYAENTAERDILCMMMGASQDYEYSGTNGLIHGNYLKEFMQHMGLKPAVPIVFIKNKGLRVK